MRWCDVDLGVFARFGVVASVRWFLVCLIMDMAWVADFRFGDLVYWFFGLPDLACDCGCFVFLAACCVVGLLLVLLVCGLV